MCRIRPRNPPAEFSIGEVPNRLTMGEKVGKSSLSPTATTSDSSELDPGGLEFPTSQKALVDIKTADESQAKEQKHTATESNRKSGKARNASLPLPPPRSDPIPPPPPPPPDHPTLVGEMSPLYFGEPLANYK
jgi:hypothetical protein